MTIRTALISNGIVEHVIIAHADYKPTAGVIAIASQTANIGDSYDGAEFIRPSVAKSKSALTAYANAKQAKISKGGITVNVGNILAPIKVSVDTSVAGRVDLGGLVQQATLNDKFSATWVQAAGNVSLTASQIKKLPAAVGQFIEASYVTLGQVLAAIDAGKITTLEQIDSPPSPIAAWPLNS